MYEYMYNTWTEYLIPNPPQKKGPTKKLENSKIRQPCLRDSDGSCRSIETPLSTTIMMQMYLGMVCVYVSYVLWFVWPKGVDDLCICNARSLSSVFPLSLPQILFLQYSQKIYPCKPRFLTLSLPAFSISTNSTLNHLGKPPSRSWFFFISSQISFRKCDTMPKIKMTRRTSLHKFLPPAYYLLIN